MGVVQHHDAITGTEKQEVAYDYAQRLSTGIDSAAVCQIKKKISCKFQDIFLRM
jgi:lysosomal alpha-mannosidase